MKKYPSITIAIPTYNEEKNIHRCLSSIFDQQYPGDIHVFIIDGGSTDQTIEIAKKFAVQILKNPFKQAEYGKKIGLMASTDTYFMILDCDMDLVGTQWFEKMTEPLERDSTIIGSWVRFISRVSDAPLNRYITLDPIQRDPLFMYLTPAIEQCVVDKNDRYWTVEYDVNRLLPAGFCLFRRKQILETPIKNLKKYMELDNLILLLEAGEKRYAYVQNVGIHHPFLTTFNNLIRKRKRNLETMYFNQPNKRYWTWIDWKNPLHILKLIVWIVYCYLLIPSVIVGIYKSIRYKTIVGMYELTFNVLTTNAIIMSFLHQRIRNRG